MLNRDGKNCVMSQRAPCSLSQLASTALISQKKNIITRNQIFEIGLNFSNF